MESIPCDIIDDVKEYLTRLAHVNPDTRDSPRSAHMFHIRSDILAVLIRYAEQENNKEPIELYDAIVDKRVSRAAISDFSIYRDHEENVKHILMSMYITKENCDKWVQTWRDEIIRNQSSNSPSSFTWYDNISFAGTILFVSAIEGIGRLFGYK